MKCLMICVHVGEFIKFGTRRPFGDYFNKDGISCLIKQIDLEGDDHYISKVVIKRRLGKYADA